jgi:hypothetical protein
MQENFILSIWEFWWDFKYLTTYIRNLRIPELLIQETLLTTRKERYAFFIR